MRTPFRFFAIGLGILLGTPAWAQVESTQQQTTTAPAPNITQEQVPAMPSIQDVRSPLNTISNRPRATTGAQPGAAAGTGQTGLTPGARTAFPGSDLQLRIQEFQFQQLQEDLQAEQRERNEFQQFVMQSIGRDLPMFGANLFRTVQSTFAPVDNVPVAADYVVGPGDEIQIRAWGQIDVDYNAVVERDGTISVPKVGVINVAGIKASDLPAFLKTVFGRTFRNFQLTATLGRLRSIQIFVVGQAKRPGTYTVSSLSTLVTAVFAAGGPSSKGSMRNIQLKRGNQVAAEFDLYDLLLSGDKSRDAKLLPGDVIYIPPVGPLVAVAGSVNIPAVYELRQSTVLFDLIRWAGGLATTAAGQKATIERIEDHKVRKVEEFPLDMGGLSRPVREGDLDATIGDTIRRLQTESEAAKFLDPNQVSSATQASRLQQVNKDESAKLDAARADALRLVNQIKPSQREVNWDYAVIERLNRNDLTTSLIPFNLGKAVIDGDPEQNLLLQPGDIVTVFSKEDIKVPISKQTQYIRLEGEFKGAGVYQIGPGETLRQLVERVGGLASNAYLFGAQFTRESTRVQQEKSLDDALNRLERDISRFNALRAQNVTSPEDAASLKQQAENQQALLTRLRQIRPIGRIVLELPEAAQTRDLPDLPLEDGDRFLVPSQPSMVSVFGSVYTESSFIYRPEKPVADYLSQAGGPTKSGDEGSIYVLRADGSVKSKQQTRFFTASLEGSWLRPGYNTDGPEEPDPTTILPSTKGSSKTF